MKLLKIFLLILALLPASNSYALVITHLHNIDNQISGYQTFTFDLISQGYNPTTDVINWVVFSFDVKEIVEDPFEDTPADMDEREFVTIYDRFLYVRGTFPDMDTGVVSERLYWTPMDTCRFYTYIDDQEICSFQPDQDGMFYSYWSVDTDNLWMNSISLSIEVTRTNLDEPSSLLLFAWLVPLLIMRRRKLR